MNGTGWSRLSQTMAWDGFRKIELREYLQPDGRSFTFKVKIERDPVCILPITKEGNVVVARQFRPGPERLICELPGGSIDSGESAEDAAARELIEETGYRGNLQFVSTNLADGYSTMIRHIFVAIDCLRVADPEGHYQEPIDVLLMSIDEFRDHLRRGDCSDVATGYMGLDFLGLLDGQPDR